MREEFRGIVRIAGKDVVGTLPLVRALTRVRGVGINMGKIIGNITIKSLKLPPDIKVGELTEEELRKVEEIITNPMKYGVPPYFTNRRGDLFSGETSHIVGNDLVFAVKQDIQREVDSRTWRGFRHNMGQKVRGQRTRTTGRKGMTVGVIRKKLIPGTAAAATGAAAPALEKADKKTAGAPAAAKPAAPAAGAAGKPAGSAKAPEKK